MALRTNTVVSRNILSALGGSVDPADDVLFSREGPPVYDEGLGSLAGTTLASFRTQMPCASSFGAPGEPVQIDAATVAFEGGHTHAYIAGVATKTITDMVLGGTGRSEHHLSSADVDTLRCKRGRHNISGTAVVDELHAYAGAVAWLRQGAAAADDVFAHGGGTVMLERDAGHAEANNGGVLELGHADATPTTCELRGGVLRPVLAVPATLTVYEGVIDTRRMAVPWPASTINVEGPLTVIASAAGGAGAWFGAATLNDNAKIQVVVRETAPV